jgi:phosphoribosylformylglycinamidine (FGAM) synthase PurS component
VRQGKFFEVEVDAADEASAEATVKARAFIGQTFGNGEGFCLAPDSAERAPRQRRAGVHGGRADADIEGALRSLGITGIAGVRQGKFFEVEVDAADEASAEARGGLLSGSR